MTIEDKLDFQEVEDNTKLTDWKKEPSVEDLHDDYIEARKSHKDHSANVEKWLDNLRIEGSAKRPVAKNRSSVVPKLIRKQAEWRYAALSEPFLSSDDIFETAPETFEDKEGAEQAGLILNHQFNTKIRKVNFIDEYIRTAVDEGTVIVRVGWEYKDEEVEVEEPEYELVPVLDPMLAQQMMQQGQEPVQQIQIGTVTRKETRVIKNQPTVNVCNYEDVIIDPTCEGDFDKANFVIFSFQTSISQLKKEGIYKNLDKINTATVSKFVAEGERSEPKDESSFEFKDDLRKKLTAYEYWGFWDINDTGILEPIVATFVGDTIIRLQENPFPDKKLPFVIVQYLPVRKSLYGEPDGALLEDNQNILGAVTRGMIDILGRSANGQMGVAKGSLDVTNKRKFDKGEDYEFNPNISPDRTFYTHTYPDIPRSAQYMIELQNADAESLTGVKAFHSGISGASLGKVATGVRSALDAASKRELGILRRLAQGIIEIGRKIMAMNAEFLSEEETVRITNEEFVTIRRDDLAGNYDIRLTISTAESDNQKAEELAFMLQTIGNSMDMSFMQMILTDIAKLRKMPTLAKKIEEYTPQPNPLAEKEQQLKIALLEAQVMNERAKADENAADLQLKTAKTKTELAKGRNLHSKSDLADLDFLKSDAGITRREQLEDKELEFKQQLDLKAADKLLTADGMVPQ